MKLYDHPFSIVPWRVRIVLQEKGIEYETIKTNLYSKPATDEFLVLNPFAQIPVIDDDGIVISESLAIMEYLEERFPTPKLMPDEPHQRAKVRNLICWCSDYWPSAWKKWMAPRFPEGLGDPWTEESVQAGRDEITYHLDVLERELQNQNWLVGEYSLADIGYAPFVLVLDRVDLGDEVEQRPNLREWANRLTERQAIIDTMMPPS